MTTGIVSGLRRACAPATHAEVSVFYAHKRLTFSRASRAPSAQPMPPFRAVQVRPNVGGVDACLPTTPGCWCSRSCTETCRPPCRSAMPRAVAAVPGRFAVHPPHSTAASGASRRAGDVGPGTYGLDAHRLGDDAVNAACILASGALAVVVDLLRRSSPDPAGSVQLLPGEGRRSTPRVSANSRAASATPRAVFGPRAASVARSPGRAG